MALTLKTKDSSFSLSSLSVKSVEEELETFGSYSATVVGGQSRGALVSSDSFVRNIKISGAQSR